MRSRRHHHNWEELVHTQTTTWLVFYIHWALWIFPPLVMSHTNGDGELVFLHSIEHPQLFLIEASEFWCITRYRELCGRKGEGHADRHADGLLRPIQFLPFVSFWFMGVAKGEGVRDEGVGWGESWVCPDLFLHNIEHHWNCTRAENCFNFKINP